VEARRRELETGRHLLQLAQREAAQLRHNAAAQRAQQADLDARALALDTACLRAEDDLQRVAAARQWTQRQLEAWAEAEESRAEDSLALEQERRRDEREIKDLMAQVRNEEGGRREDACLRRAGHAG
jgi:hypothetical protein